DLAEVLQTEFSAITVGYSEYGRIYQYLPPQPPPVHYSVYQCSDEELVEFCSNSDFFRTVLFAYQLPSDELLCAAVRTCARVQRVDNSYLLRDGRKIYNLLNDDYVLLTAILRRIQP